MSNGQSDLIMGETREWNYSGLPMVEFEARNTLAFVENGLQGSTVLRASTKDQNNVIGISSEQNLRNNTPNPTNQYVPDNCEDERGKGAPLTHTCSNVEPSPCATSN